MATSERVYAHEFVRPYASLRNEIGQAFELVRPRFGRFPRIGLLKIIDACQMDCHYCDANKPRGKIMETEEVYRVLENLAAAGVQLTDLTGGETTLRADLPQIVSYSKELGMVTTLNSNGGIGDIDYKYWYDLAEAGLFGVNFSYDGTGEKSDPKVIQLASFCGQKLHIYSGIRMVVGKENLNRVYEIGEECILNNVFFQAIPAVALGGETSASATDFKPLDYEERLQLIESLNNLSRARKPTNFLRIPRRYLNEVVGSPDLNSWHCHNPSSHWISVNAQGNTRVCGDRPLSKVYSLTGDTNPLLSEEFHQEVKKEAKKCDGCSWLCHWEGNRGQLERGLDQLRLFLTIGAVT